ncbi:4Fe-4S binding protein [Chrysiogenes arsenatis]|uniref:4Fe-4S binding protein n=1 Tax=Chrysiogenes arsenatis TaxID=309797 RepID=UPI0003FF7284|nr:4Fe-4S binding protein [Chrysiogenes arsenatis]
MAHHDEHATIEAPAAKTGECVSMINTVFAGAKAIATGMKTVLKYAGGPRPTREYPEVVRPLAERSRGRLYFIEEKCIACNMCVKACPIDVIHLESHREDREVDGKVKKVPVIDKYTVDIGECISCGLCAEHCPTDAVFQAHEYETAYYYKELFVMNKDELAMTFPEFIAKKNREMKGK